MPRLLFTKTGDAIWMSHLDLMRVFQRAFKRAGLPLTHTQGYNPRPSVSIALPLSVGVESVCELLDFDLEGETVDCDVITQKLNASLMEGVRILKTYQDGRKIRDLSLLSCVISLEYDAGIPEGTEEAVRSLFARETLTVEKKGKNGVTEQNIIPMIRKFEIHRLNDQALQLRAVVCCQNPSLNPMQLVAAIRRYIPDHAPDFAKCRREEILDNNEMIFR